MATSSEITPRDVVNALQTLTDEQSYKLFYHLEVPLHTLSTITSDYKGDMRKIHYVKAWFDHDVDVSWDTIVYIYTCTLFTLCPYYHAIALLYYLY